MVDFIASSGRFDAVVVGSERSAPHVQPRDANEHDRPIENYDRADLRGRASSVQAAGAPSFGLGSRSHLGKPGIGCGWSLQLEVDHRRQNDVTCARSFDFARRSARAKV